MKYLTVPNQKILIQRFWFFYHIITIIFLISKILPCLSFCHSIWYTACQRYIYFFNFSRINFITSPQKRKTTLSLTVTGMKCILIINLWHSNEILAYKSKLIFLFRINSFLKYYLDRINIQVLYFILFIQTLLLIFHSFINLKCFCLPIILENTA